jgi:hypothetical protein
MGNVHYKQPDLRLLKFLGNYHIKILNSDERIKIENFIFESFITKKEISLIATKKHRADYVRNPINYILCKSYYMEDIIENTKLGHECISYMYCSKDPLINLSIRNIWHKHDKNYNKL